MARIKWDTIGPHSVNETSDGIEIVRGLQVLDIEIDPGESDPNVILKCFALPGFPKRGDKYPGPYAPEKATLRRRQGRSIDRVINAVNFDLHYSDRSSRGITTLPDVVKWTVEDIPVPSYVPVYATSSGQPLFVLYRKQSSLAGNQEIVTPNSATGYVKKITPAQKLRIDRMIRVTARISQETWDAFKQAVRDLAGKVNADSWKGYERARWLFTGPYTRTDDEGENYDLQLDFMYNKDGHFPLLAYFNEFGDHPADSAPESVVKASLPIPAGNIRVFNGLTAATIYEEGPFTGVFNFSPD